MSDNMFDLGSESGVEPPHSKADSVHHFVVLKSRERFAATINLVEDLTESDARAGACPDWPTHEYHVGQDGSIAGIVHHVAAWRQVYIELLRGQNLEPTDLSPPSPGWDGRKRWLADSAEEWLELTESITESEAVVPVKVPGVSAGLTPLKMMWTILEHEIEHSAQITYILERRKCAS